MLDVRPTAYIVPLTEQVLDDITPVIQVTSTGDEDARVTGLVRIYRWSTDQLLYTSELATTIVTHHTTVNIAALSAWSPPAPCDDDYFIMVDTLATGTAPDPPMRSTLGAFRFDIKAGPMGPAPAAHHTTHESGGMDEIDITGLTPLNLYQLLTEKGQPNGYPDLDATAMVPTSQLGTGAPNGTKYLRDDQTWEVPPGGGGTPLSETPQTLTDQAVIDWDLSLGGAATVTLGGNRTLNAPTNMVDGAHYSLRVIQDGTGTRLITWNAAYRFPGGVDPCLSAAINCIDLLEFRCDGSNLDCIAMTNALA